MLKADKVDYTDCFVTVKKYNQCFLHKYIRDDNGNIVGDRPLYPIKYLTLNKFLSDNNLKAIWDF